MASYRLKKHLIVEATQNENGYWEIKYDGRNCMMEDGPFKELYEPVYDEGKCEESGHMWTYRPGDQRICLRCGLYESIVSDHKLILRPINEEELAKNTVLQAKYELAKKISEGTLLELFLDDDSWVNDMIEIGEDLLSADEKVKDLHDLNNPIDEIQEKT